MPNLNRVFLMGNLTKDPEMRYTTNGAAVCNLGMAINRKYKVKEEMKEDVCFLTVVTWNKSAEACAQYLHKGDPIFVEGRLQSSSWETENKEKRHKLEVVADRVEFLVRGEKKQVQEGPMEGMPTPDPKEEDIPF